MGAHRQKYVVRVVLPPPANNFLPSANVATTTLLESLRYAGLVQIHREDDDGMCFDILPPAIVKSNEGSRNWALTNAERMESFGFNAVAAPAWVEVGRKKE